LTPTTLAGLARDMQTGVESVTFAASAFHSRTITFPRAFAAVPSIVIPMIDSASAETDRWIVRTFNVAATSFGLSLVESTNTARAWTAGRSVRWLAVLL
jgi:hypothetical protein